MVNQSEKVTLSEFRQMKTEEKLKIIALELQMMNMRNQKTEYFGKNGDSVVKFSFSSAQKELKEIGYKIKDLKIVKNDKLKSDISYAEIYARYKEVNQSNDFKNVTLRMGLGTAEFLTLLQKKYPFVKKGELSDVALLVGITILLSLEKLE